jgi:hypothetical protein
MTSAEAIGELRLLVTQARASGAHAGELLFMLYTAREIAERGVDPLAELRLRRFRRLYGDGHGGNGHPAA